MINVGIFPPASAPECMRCDEELLAKAENGESNARIYEWKNPAVSVPRSFSSDGVDFEALKNAGVEFVKRPTGGGILVHGFDLSYSAAVPRTVKWAGLGIDEAGLLLAQPVLESLIRCGYKAVFRTPESHGKTPKQPLCAVQKSPLDILISGRKVAAFAQRRTARGIFQHGSINLRGIPNNIISSVKKAGLGTELEWQLAGEAVSFLEEHGPVDLDLLKGALREAVGGG